MESLADAWHSYTPDYLVSIAQDAVRWSRPHAHLKWHHIATPQRMQLQRGSVRVRKLRVCGGSTVGVRHTPFQACWTMQAVLRVACVCGSVLTDAARCRTSKSAKNYQQEQRCV